MSNVDLDECKIIDLDKTKSTEGTVVRINNNQNLPFAVKRVFYIYDVNFNATRGNHAHRECHQVLIALNGSLNLSVDNGVEKKEVLLDNPSNGFYIPPGIWAIQSKFSVGSICLVLASHMYDEKDYMRNYKEYVSEVNK